MKKLRWGITIGAVALLAAHLLMPEFKVDAATVILLAFIVIPWLSPIFKVIELPGGVKIEFAELQNAQQKAQEAGLLAPPEPPELQNPSRYTFEKVAKEDPNLALAGLRIELESRLHDLAKARNIPEKNKGARWLIHSLSNYDVLKPAEVSVLEDLLPLLNSAVHGAAADLRASEWAVAVGPRLIRTLEDRLGKSTMNDLLARWRQRDGAAGAEVGTELSRALVKTPLAFLKAMHEDPDSFNSWLEAMQYHTFTLYQSRDDLDDELYTSQYERLKQLMIEALGPFLTSEYGAEAKRIQETLRKVIIRRISRIEVE